MYIVVLVIHVLVSIMLILFILLQTGKGADLGAMLGGGGANTLFGATGATSFLSKLTTYSAVVFMITCLTLAYLSSHNPSTMDGMGPVAPVSGETDENPASEALPPTDEKGVDDKSLADTKSEKAETPDKEGASTEEKTDSKDGKTEPIKEKSESEKTEKTN